MLVYTLYITSTFLLSLSPSTSFPFPFSYHIIYPAFLVWDASVFASLWLLYDTVNGGTPYSKFSSRLPASWKIGASSMAMRAHAKKKKRLWFVIIFWGFLFLSFLWQKILSALHMCLQLPWTATSSPRLLFFLFCQHYLEQALVLVLIPKYTRGNHPTCFSRFQEADDTLFIPVPFLLLYLFFWGLLDVSCAWQIDHMSFCVSVSPKLEMRKGNMIRRFERCLIFCM